MTRTYPDVWLSSLAFHDIGMVKRERERRAREVDNERGERIYLNAEGELISLY